MLYILFNYFLYNYILLKPALIILIKCLNQNPPARPRSKIKTRRFRFFGSSSGLSSGTKTARVSGSGSVFGSGLLIPAGVRVGVRVREARYKLNLLGLMLGLKFYIYKKNSKKTPPKGRFPL